MTSEKMRREPRIDISLPVVLQLPDGELNYQLSNASYRGVFIACPEPLPLRKLVRFQTHLSEDDEPLQMLGLVAHTINSVEAHESGKTAGMGLQLFGVGSQTRDRWRDFITARYEEDPEARDRVREMEAASVQVHLRSIEQLHTFARHDLEQGSIFVRTSELSPADATITCNIVHPVEDEIFSLEARVIEVKEAPRRERGMRIEFSPLDEEQRAQFEVFAQLELLDADSEAELLELDPDSESGLDYTSEPALVLDSEAEEI